MSMIERGTQASRSDSSSVRYRVPTAVTASKAAARKLFAVNGRVPFVRPLDENNSGLVFKKGRQGLSLTLTQWLGRPDGTVVDAEHAQLAFVCLKGPATLELGRVNDETTIELVQRNAEAAAKANVLPIAGQARLIFGYLVPDVAALAINGQTIEIAGGVNHPQTPDLPPGTYP